MPQFEVTLIRSVETVLVYTVTAESYDRAYAVAEQDAATAVTTPEAMAKQRQAEWDPPKVQVDIREVIDLD